MNQAARPIVRGGFLLTLFIVLGSFIITAMFLPTRTGNRRPKLPRIMNNLKQIEIAKQAWALEQAATNGTKVTESELAAILVPRQGQTGLVNSANGEVYFPNAIGTPPEARLEKPISALPAGTLIRWSTNAGFEKLLPSEKDRSGGWRPLFPLTR